MVRTCSIGLWCERRGRRRLRRYRGTSRVELTIRGQLFRLKSGRLDIQALAAATLSIIASKLFRAHLTHLLSLLRALFTSWLKAHPSFSHLQWPYMPMFRHSVFFAFSLPFGARGEAAPLRASPEFGANVAMSDATEASSPTTFVLLGLYESSGVYMGRKRRFGALEEKPRVDSLAPSVSI